MPVLIVIFVSDFFLIVFSCTPCASLEHGVFQATGFTSLLETDCKLSLVYLEVLFEVRNDAGVRNGFKAFEE